MILIVFSLFLFFLINFGPRALDSWKHQVEQPWCLCSDMITCLPCQWKASPFVLSCLSPHTLGSLMVDTLRKILAGGPWNRSAFPKLCPDFVQSNKQDRGLAKAVFLKEGIEFTALVGQSSFWFCARGIMFCEWACALSKGSWCHKLLLWVKP